MTTPTAFTSRRGSAASSRSRRRRARSSRSGGQAARTRGSDPTVRTSASTSRDGTPSRVVGADKPHKVETRFVQVAEATKKPWNFYYWPTKTDSIHEPWAGGNGRVDTDYSMIRGDDQMIRTPGSYIPPGEDIVLAGPNGLLETVPAAGRRRHVVPEPVRRPDLDRAQQGEGRRDHDLPDPLSPPQVRPDLRHSGAVVGSDQHPEQGNHPLARPLPGRSRRVDPAERADPGARDQPHQG